MKRIAIAQTLVGWFFFSVFMMAFSPCFADQSVDNLANSPFFRFVQDQIKRGYETSHFESAHSSTISQTIPFNSNPNDIQNPFQTHIRDAISTNEKRSQFYSTLSNRKSQKISNNLLSFEKLCLIPAKGIDLWAKGFNKSGIKIIQNDFVSMEKISPPETPPLYRGCLSKPAKAFLKEKIRLYQRQFIDHAFRGKFETAASITLSILKTLREAERENYCHLAFTIHLVESLGFGALHAVSYAKQSQGKTTNLSRMFLLAQALPLQFALSFDEESQKLHALGIGILVNDLFTKELPNRK